jgi:hypothetical protein
MARYSVDVTRPTLATAEARSALTKRFLQDVMSVWEQRGIEALQKVAIKAPDKFLELVTQLVPKDVTIEHTAANPGGVQVTADRIRELLTRAAARRDSLSLPDGSLLPVDVCVSEEGRGEGVDTGALPGSAERS